MIIGKRQDLATYRGISPRLDIAINYLLTLSADVEDGTYELDGRQVYAIVSTGETKIPDAPRYEFHRRYIDLQYILDGEEEVGYIHITDCTEAEPYNEKKDCQFMHGNGTTATLRTGNFYICHPFDGHMPMRHSKPAPVRKVVVKVLI
ncbi:MAG: DUF386 domain-containing protein [Ruminococcaceae bacterium]|nr:DUF386 domain-containing protein [Oscillospiraceae bacterium]